MLRIYICPKCYNFRMVSRKPDAICFHCGSNLDKCDMEYPTYMNMSEEERFQYKNDYINRMKQYNDKVTALFEDHNIIK
jgi:hypothetical protein